MTILLILVLIVFTIAAVSMLIEFRAANAAFTRLTSIITRVPGPHDIELDEGVVYIIRWRTEDGRILKMEKDTFQSAVATLILLQATKRPRDVSLRALDKIRER